MTREELLAFTPSLLRCETHLGALNYAVPTLSWLIFSMILSLLVSLTICAAIRLKKRDPDEPPPLQSRPR